MALSSLAHMANNNFNEPEVHLRAAARAQSEAEEADTVLQAQVALAQGQLQATYALIGEVRALRKQLQGEAGE